MRNHHKCVYFIKVRTLWVTAQVGLDAPCSKDWVQKGESAQLPGGEEKVLPSWGDSVCEGRQCMTFMG